MGCGSSGSAVGADPGNDNQKDKRNSRISDINEMLVRMKDCMGALKMSHAEIARFHDYTRKMDANVNHHISQTEFIGGVDVHPVEMACKLFQMMGIEHSVDETHKKAGSTKEHEIHVAEVFLGLFHFSIRTGKHLHEDFWNKYSRRTVQLGHGKKCNVLEIEDMKAMLTDMVGKEYMVQNHGALESAFTLDDAVVKADGVEEAVGKELQAAIDYHGFKKKLPDQFHKTREAVCQFRDEFEAHTMTNIFGSETKWQSRKKEIISILDERGFSSVGGLFMKGLNMHLQTHKTAVDIDFDAGRGKGTTVKGDGVKRHSHHSSDSHHHHHSHHSSDSHHKKKHK